MSTHDQEPSQVPAAPSTTAPFTAAPPPPPSPSPSPPPQPPSQPLPPSPRRPTPWLALTVTALVAALLAGGGTAAVLTALDTDDDAGSGTSQGLSHQDSPDAGDPGDPGDPGKDEAPVTATRGSAPDWESVARAVRDSVVAITVRGAAGGGEGSGVVVDDEGRIITNHHVVDGARTITVTLVDGRVYDAELVGTDPTTDVAVVALVDPPDDLVPATLGDSDGVVVGEPVMAVGNPLGLASTATTGIVSAVDRPVSTGVPGAGELVVTNAIQVDAAINPGNSGGPLFDASGRVIGVNSSILTTSQSSGSIGLGFAIPANLAQRVAEELVADGSADHAFLGVRMSDGTATADRTTRVGATIEEVVEDAPAAEAGLRRGDVVVAIDGEAVSGAESLTAQVRERGAGDEATLTVVRDGEVLEVVVTLASRDGAVPVPSSRG